ncbi:MAG: S1/P1 Nuclease, partial [Chitinophagaceae bacterium]|nr:S1/P1 Nuclease [Chitinophagaceae bacterium]
MKYLIALLLSLFSIHAFGWGFFAHKKINQYAVFLLPPEMMVLFKPKIDFITEHAIDPDKRRYAVPDEGPRHYIDIDHYGVYPYDSLPRKWNDA